MSGRVFDELKWEAVGTLGNATVKGLFASTRIEIRGWEPVRGLVRSRRFIAAFWHSRILMMSHIWRGMNGAILVSASRDGEYIARVLQKQGHETIRGSTTHGGRRAFARLIRAMRGKVCPSAVIPDGPQGPRFKAQPGVIHLAAQTGYPIVPMTYAAKRMKVFSSWDRFILPYPFTECTIIYGRPVYVDPRCGKNGIKHDMLVLENELNRITREADGGYGHIVR